MITIRAIFSFYHSEKFWVLSDQLLVSGAAFITSILAARQLGVTAFGWFALVIMMQLFLLTIQNALITSPYQVLQANYTEQNRYRYIHSLFYIQMLFLLLNATMAIGLYLIHPAWLQPFAGAWWWITLASCGYLLQDFIRRVLITEKKASRAFVIDAVTNLLQIIILAILFFHGQLRFENCWLVIGITFIPSLALGCYWLNPGKVCFKSIRQTLQLHGQQGKWLLLTSLLQWWAGNLFIIAAGLLIGVQAFGALRLAQNIFGILNVLLQAFENYVMPNAAKLYLQSQSHLTKYIQQVSVKTSFYVIPVLIALALFARPILRLAGGKQYESYFRVVQGLSVLYLFIFIGYPVRIAIRVLLLNRVFFIGYLISTAFSFLAASRFILWWGVMGIVTGLIINQLLLVSYWLFVLQRKKLYLWR